MPEDMGYLAGLNWELKRTSDPLTWQEMDAWTRMMHRQIEPEEARVLMKMGGIHCQVMNEPE